jgi:hypothetical protein
VDPIPPVERHIALDLARRGLLIAPLVILLAGVLRGFDGAAGAAVGLGIVLANFLIAAYAIGRVAGTTPKLVGAVALGSYVVRLGTILVALLLLRNVDALDFVALGITLVAAHLLLLAWEAPHVSMSLAAPGLKPRPPVTQEELSA